MKIPDIVHLRPVAICKFQMTVQGKVRIITSSTSSVHDRARYIEISSMVVPGWSGNQFFEIGQAWNKEAKKKAIVHRSTPMPTILVMMRNRCVENIL